MTDQSHRVAADELQSILQRIERTEAEKSDAAEAQKEIYAEAKGRGYDGKIIRKLVALRKRSPDDIAEEDAIMDMYKQALGM